MSATRDFILSHRDADVSRLALMRERFPEVDMPYALQQIEAWQTARTKVPSWADVEGIVYPRRLSMEQCSSEPTARYKAGVATRLMRDFKCGAAQYLLADLTGGFGIDFSFMAKALREATDNKSQLLYVESQTSLCQTAENNFPLLGIDNVEIVNTTAEEVIKKDLRSNVIFLDPSRRDENGSRTYSIADCLPDYCQLQERLLDMADIVMIKLSPMLDIADTISRLDHVGEVHVVGTRQECKELLVVASRHYDKDHRIGFFCNVDDEVLALPDDFAQIPITLSESVAEGLILAEPVSVVMKMGCFGFLCKRFQLEAIAPNSHLFIGNTDVAENLPDNFFRHFIIKKVSSMNKSYLKKALSGTKKANLTVRNFPLSARQLMNRLRLSDGGDTYIFATTDSEGNHIIIICEKRKQPTR